MSESNQKNNTFISWEEAVLWLRGQPDQKELVNTCFYDDPLIAAAIRFFESSEWQATRDLLAGVCSGKALDLGAGRGISSFALARDGWQVTALEPDPSAVVGANAIRSLSAEADLDIEVCESFGEKLPFPDNYFTLVYARQVLHHANDLEILCQEIYRVLKPGGIVLATREHVIDSVSDLHRFQMSHPLHSLYGGEYAYTLPEYIRAMTKAGLTLDNILAPYDSDINLFPATRGDVRAKVSGKLGFRPPKFMFEKIIIPLLNRLLREPGRLYTFSGVK